MKALQFNVSIPQFAALKVWGVLDKSACYRGPLATIKLVDRPQPALRSADWVKIRVLRCGVCRSDINTITLDSSPAWTPYCSFPSVLGHEFSGRITEAGADAGGLAPGDLVTVNPVLNCRVRGIEEECAACRKGLGCCENFAEGSLAPGAVMDTCRDLNGGYSEYVVAHKSQVYKVPAGVSAEAAALTEPFAVALEAVLMNRPQNNEHVLVIGCGVIGYMTIRALRALDCACKITAAVNSPATTALAREAGADLAIRGGHALEEMAGFTGGKCYTPLLGKKTMMGGYDRIFDCLANRASINMSLAAARTGAVITLVGIASQFKFDPTMIWLKLLTVKGSTFYGFHEWQGSRRHAFEIALVLMAEKNLQLERIVTHTFALEDYRKMLKMNLDKRKYQAFKSLFVCDAE